MRAAVGALCGDRAGKFKAPRSAPEAARTAAYELDSWAEWCGAFRPFGRLLALLFSRRLQQLNVPLTGLDTSRGVEASTFKEATKPLQLLPPERAYHFAAGAGSSFYIGFGRKLDQMHADVWQFDLLTNEWSSVGVGAAARAPR